METITFILEQWAELLKVAPSCPKRLAKVIHWGCDDCTCIESNFAISNVIYSTRVVVVQGERSSTRLACAMKNFHGHEYCELHTDRDGKLYFEESPISRSLLLEALAELEMRK